MEQARSVAGYHIWTAANEIYNLQSLNQARSAAIMDWLHASSKIRSRISYMDCSKRDLQSPEPKPCKIRSNHGLVAARPMASKIRSNHGLIAARPMSGQSNPNPSQGEQTSHATKSLTLAMRSKP